jgi:hypothetical protein
LGRGGPASRRVRHRGFSGPAVIAHRADWESGTVAAVHWPADAPLTTAVRVGDVEAAVDQFGPAELTWRGGVVELELVPCGCRWFRLRHAGQRVAP